MSDALLSELEAVARWEKIRVDEETTLKLHDLVRRAAGRLREPQRTALEYISSALEETQGLVKEAIRIKSAQ